MKLNNKQKKNDRFAINEVNLSLKNKEIAAKFISIKINFEIRSNSTKSTDSIFWDKLKTLTTKTMT